MHAVDPRHRSEASRSRRRSDLFHHLFKQPSERGMLVDRTGYGVIGLHDLAYQGRRGDDRAWRRRESGSGKVRTEEPVNVRLIGGGMGRQSRKAAEEGGWGIVWASLGGGISLSCRSRGMTRRGALLERPDCCRGLGRVSPC